MSKIDQYRNHIRIDRLRHAEEINKTLYRIANVANTASSLADFFKEIHLSLSTIIDATNFYIAIIDKNDKSIQFPYYVDTAAKSSEPITNFEKYDFLTGLVVKDKKPLFVKKDSVQQLYHNQRIKGPFPLIWLGVPLIIEGSILGVIAVHSYTDPDCYNKKDLSILATVSDQIALAIARKWEEKDKIKAQQIASEQEKLALVGQIAGKMAHDFNNVLTVIMGNTQLLLRDCKDTNTKNKLDLILKQTLQGKNLTKNLVLFGRNQEPKQEFFEIDEKIDFVIDLLKLELADINLVKHHSKKVPDLLADPGMIEHALVNLIQNSIHALSKSDNPQIIIRTYFKKRLICFQIEDNGCGIPEEHVGNIFEPSFTLKGSRDMTGSYERQIKGTGYGMSNVKKYVDQHKGEILIETRFGVGTKVTVCLPLTLKTLTKESKKYIQQFNLQTHKKILLVEDEYTIADIQYSILTEDPCRHKVDIAKDGEIAIDFFDKNKYDLISLDYVLPRKLNGMDVYNYIRKENKKIPVLFVSGNIEFLESVKKLKQKDMFVSYLSKPCQHEEYISRINELLAKPFGMMN